MMDKIQFFGRRTVLGAAAGGLLLPRPGQAQSVLGGAVSGTAGANPAPAQPAGKAEITVDRARAAPIPVAITNLGGDETLGRQIAGVITNDLVRSGLFRPIDPQAFIATGPEETPNFANWKPTGAQALLTGRVENQGSKNRLEFRLWDVLQGTQIQGTALSTDASNWRRLAHITADAVYERLLGEKGYFDTRIVYIAGTGPRDRRTKRLAVMDQDGENNRFLTDGSAPALTPRFHPTRDEIAFMSYAQNRPRVYVFDLSTGRQQVLGNFEGMTLSPRFSPDGNSVVMAQTRGAGSDIYLVGLSGGGARRLTNSGAIDVSPCFSPDGSQIAFNSDRGGDQQIYVMAADGSGVRRISFGSGRYATPVWSPRGDLIAFTRISGGNFAIGVMRPDGSGERILSESYYCEGPSFCPNGRVIVFYRETPARDSRGNGFSQRLVTIDITGFNERGLPTPTDASDPAWSPLAA